MNDTAPDSAAARRDLDTRALARAALPAANSVLEAARRQVTARLAPGGRVNGAALDAEQTLAHGFAWLATTVEALRQTLAWADRLADSGRFGDRESALLGVAYGEYLGQIAGGIAMTQTPPNLSRNTAATAVSTRRGAVVVVVFHRRRRSGR